MTIFVACVKMFVYNIDMKKLRLYLDTSVISNLLADDAPEQMQDSKLLFDILRTGEYDVYVSHTTMKELQNCPEPKQTQMAKELASIKFSLIEDTEEIKSLAKDYLKHEVLSEKSTNDCLHIASAVASFCDIIVSWNFRHLVNFKTINKVRIVNTINNYPAISIVTPKMMIGGEA